MKKEKMFRAILSSMKTCLIVLLAAVSFTLFAQQGGKGGGRGNATPEERAKRLTEMMKEELNLTPAQEPKIEAINLKYAKKNEEVRKIADTSLQRKTFQVNNKQRDAEFRTILTAEQYKTYLKQVEEMKARRREMRH